MEKNKRKTGEIYEKVAAEYLSKKGYKILALNFYARMGEIDIIAKDGSTIVFVEVKYRKNTAYGYPEEAVIPSKIHKIRLTADYFLVKNKIEDVNVRFDVIAILDNNIKHIKDAF